MRALAALLALLPMVSCAGTGAAVTALGESLEALQAEVGSQDATIASIGAAADSAIASAEDALEAAQAEGEGLINGAGKVGDMGITGLGAVALTMWLRNRSRRRDIAAAMEDSA